jgi:hypothetical protein
LPVGESAVERRRGHEDGVGVVRRVQARVNGGGGGKTRVQKADSQATGCDTHAASNVGEADDPAPERCTGDSVAQAKNRSSRTAIHSRVRGNSH